MVETRTTKRVQAQVQQQHHQNQHEHTLCHQSNRPIVAQSRNKKMDEFMKKKRPSGAEGYAEKKQKMTLPAAESIVKSKAQCVATGRAAAHAAIAISVPTTRSSSDKNHSNKSCWNAPSNVGNLSVREKFVLAIFIFSTMTMIWAICLSYSLCGLSPCWGATDCHLIQDLALCKVTWSTLSFLTEHISDFHHSHHGLNNQTTDVSNLLLQIERLHNESRAFRMENEMLHQESASRKDEVETLTLRVIDLQKESQSFQLQIQKMEQDAIKNQKDVILMQRRLRDSTERYEDTLAKWKHCKADVLEEIYKKKACGDKLYPLQAAVEELRANLTAREAQCHQDESETANRQAVMEQMDAEINTLQQKSMKDQREISSLKHLLRESMLTNADTVAKLKHCKADVLEEIYKKKACGDKLYPLQAAVEELRANLTAREAHCHQDESETAKRQAVMEQMYAEINTWQQKSMKDQREISSLKHLLQESMSTNADTVAKLKHCKADVLEEIYKKKACGDKLYPCQAAVEELRANLTALEAQCHRDESESTERQAFRAALEEEPKGRTKKRRFQFRNPFRNLFKRKGRRSAES